MSHIFISYSRRDIDFAQKIVTALAENDLDTWIDWKSIPKGEDWKQEIYRGIEEADAFLFLISPDSVASKMCNKEIVHAVRNNKRILPILIREADRGIIPDEISKRNWIFCRDGQDDFINALEETRKTIHTDYDWLKQHTELQVKALRWETRQDVSRLLRGKELREAEQILAEINDNTDPQPTTLQRQYLLNSRRNVDRLRRVVTGSSIGVAVIMVVLALVAWGQRNTAVAERNVRATAQANEQIARETAEANEKRAEEQATIALARQLASQAELLNAAEKKLETSTLLAALSLQIYPNNEASLFLQRNLDLLPRTHNKFSLEGTVLQTQFSADGDYLFIVTQDRSVQKVDWRSGQILRGIHVDFDIEKVIQSKDGRKLLIQGGPLLSVWDVSVGTQLAEFQQRFWDMERMAINPDLEWAAVTDPENPNDVLIYDFIIGQPPVRISRTSSITAIAISPDGSHLAIASEDSSVQMWNHESAVLQWDMVLAGPVRNIVFTSDGSNAAFLVNDDQLVVSKVANGMIVYQFSGGDRKIDETVSFSPDGRKLIISGQSMIINGAFGKESGAVEKVVSLIDTSSWKLVKQVNAPVDGGIVYHSQGRLAAMFAGEWLYVVDLSQGIVLKKIQNNYDIENVIWDTSAGPEWISTIPSRSGCNYTLCVPAIRVWDLDSLQEVKRIGEGQYFRFAYGMGGWIAASQEQGSDIRIWSMFPEQTITLTDNSFLSGPPGGNVRFSSDGKWLAASEQGGRLKVYQLSTDPKSDNESNWLSFAIHDTGGYFVFSPNSHFLATINNEGMATVWNVLSGEAEFEIQAKVRYFDFSPDGSLLAFLIDDGSIQIYDALSGGKVVSIDPGPELRDNALAIAFDQDGSEIVSSSGGENGSTLSWWDITTGAKTREQKYEGKVFGLKYSPGGNVLSLSIQMTEETICILSNRQDGDITVDIHSYCGEFSTDGQYLLQNKENSLYVWDTMSNSYLKQLDHPGAVRQAMFSGDGKYILTTSFDGKTRVWDFTSGLVVGEAWQPSNLAYTADINPVDGRIAMMGANNNVLRLVYWQKEVLIDYACKRVSRDLTDYEWAQYVGDALPTSHGPVCSDGIATLFP